jgi:hypothetical protein
MASRYNRPAANHVPDLIEHSDSEELESVSEGESTQQELNDRRLAQAANYLQQEGGHDSPATFINRVDRIDAALLQLLPQQGRDYDQQLYREVHDMVRNIQLEYENATESDSTLLESEEDLPQYYAPTAAEEEALYREEEEPTPSSKSVPRPAHPKSTALASRRSGSEDDVEVERERVFKYGGPHNDVENWHRDFPATLPFPETHLMAHWESLRIDYDLARSNQDTVMETDVPFDHAYLKPYFELPQYESGSRFKLPQVDQNLQRYVSDYGTTAQLEKDALSFNDGHELKRFTEERAKDYAPRIFLDFINVSKQCE